MLEFPRKRFGLVQEMGARLLDSRKPNTPTDSLARDLLAGFRDICMRCGLDRILVELERESALYEHPTLRPALGARLDAVDLDGGGPRNVRPRLLAECLVAALGLTLTDDADQTITLEDTVRTEVIAAIASVVDVELGTPQVRDGIIRTARERCEERYLGAFDKIAAQLDERGMRVTRQPKVPIDAAQAVQRLLADARNAVVERGAAAAIDRAKLVLARAHPDAAARIDQPVTHEATPRSVAILRVCDYRTSKVPGTIAETLLESLTDLASIAWRAPERPVRTYSPKETFAVGELIEHPKFGRGAVISVALQRVEVEFADGRHTLVHMPPAK